MHTVVVIHQNAGDLPCHAGRNKRHVPIHECVVRGGGVEHRLDPRDAEHEENCENSNTEHTCQKRSLPRSLSGLLRHGAGLRRCVRGFRVVGSRSISICCRLRVDRTWLVALLGHVGHPLRWDETDDVEWTPLVLTGKIPLVLTEKIPRPPLGGVGFQRGSAKENSSVARPVAEAVSREDVSGCRHRGREQTQFGISWPQGE